MDKIYVVNSTTQNLNSAKKYGQLKIITEGNVPIFKTELMISLLREDLKNFKETDYLLAVGPMWLNAIAVAMLLSKFRNLKVLVFDAKIQQYIVRHLNYDSYSLI